MTTVASLLTPQRPVGIERPIDLMSLHVRYDLDEHGHDCTGPEGPTERVEQVGQESGSLLGREAWSAYPPT